MLGVFLCCASLGYTQSANMKRNMEDNIFVDRLDILNGRISDTLFTTLNAMSRKDVVHFLENYLITHPDLTIGEKEDIQNIISKNGEWAANGDGAAYSKWPIFNTFYIKKPDFLNVQTHNADLIVNPIIAYQQTVESGNGGQTLFVNSKGLEVRGRVANRLGFYSAFTDNQERGPRQFQNYMLSHAAVPGNAYYKDFKLEKPGNGVDYINACGYIDAEVIKNTINVSFGHDRFHIGDGYRSLFLSDFGANYLFAKINTRIWKVNYQNLFMELTPQYKRGGDQLLPKKYAAMHHLSINVAPWLNVGLFEGIIFGRKDHFEFQYMNPIILYRSIEQGAGSPDNALLGLNFKMNPGRFNTVVYGQLLLDEFKFAEIKSRKGWWGNKYGIQLGCKIADPFGIVNLLIQPEINIVRPFTYSFRDSSAYNAVYDVPVADYTHYNQPLAHPFGANFSEFNLLVQYIPVQHLILSMKTFYNKQGRDTASSVSFGGDIFKSYKKKNSDYGIRMYNGATTTVWYTNLNASYELRDNFYIDLGLTFRNEKSSFSTNPNFASNQFYVGFRLNAARRQYDY